MQPPVDAHITRVIREDWGRILSVLTAHVGNYALAEDSLQDAVLVALDQWQNGLPDHPDAWLLTVARRKAVDRLRRTANASRKEQELALFLEQTRPDPQEMGVSPDHRLELIFACCHPALAEKSRTALTLRAIGGLTTPEIAAAFLDKPDAMAARLSWTLHSVVTHGDLYHGTIQRRTQIQRCTDTGRANGITHGILQQRLQDKSWYQEWPDFWRDLRFIAESFTEA